MAFQEKDQAELEAEVQKGNGKGKGRAAKARTDGQQEAVLKAEPVKKNIGQLVKLFNTAKEASEDLSAGIKATAEKAGLNAKALRSFVAARAGENFEEKQREVEQMTFLFEKVGE